MLDFLFPATNPSVPRVEDEGQEPNPPSGGVGLMKGWKELAETDSLYMKGAVSALRALMDIRSGSSTVSMFSLPPLQINVLEDCCNRIHLLEQVAKQRSLKERVLPLSYILCFCKCILSLASLHGDVPSFYFCLFDQRFSIHLTCLRQITTLSIHVKLVKDEIIYYFSFKQEDEMIY